MKKIFTFFSLFFFLTSLSGKDDNYELGKVTEEELSTSFYPADSTADAFYYFDIGETSIDYVGYDLKVKTNRSFKLKVLNKQGLKAGSILVKLYGNSRISAIKVTTYNLINGSIETEKFRKADLVIERISEYVQEAQINAPMVKEGSIIEVEYTIYTESLFNLYPWTFQSEYPKIYCRYSTFEPEGFEYSRITRGAIKLEKLPVKFKAISLGNDQVRSYEHTFFAEAIPAFKDEEFINSPINHISSIEYQLSGLSFTGQFKEDILNTWGSIDQLLLDANSFGAHYAYIRPFTPLGEVFRQPLQTDKDSVQAVYNFLRQELNWNQKHTYGVYQTWDEIWETRTGSSGELNYFLCHTLKQYGFDVQPMVMSTRNNGFIRAEMPSMQYFNHTVIAITLKDGRYLIDLTSLSNDCFHVPFKDLNYAARMPYSNQWFVISPTDNFYQQHVYELTLDSSLSSISGMVYIKNRGYAATQNADYKDKRDQTVLQERIVNDFPDLTVKNIGIDTTAPNSELSYNAEIKSTVGVENIGNLILVKPLLMESNRNPFSEKVRNYPIDFGYTSSIKIMAGLDIPDGLEVKELPESASYVLNGGGAKFRYQVMQVGNRLQLNYILEIKESVFSVSSYPDLREFFNACYSKIEQPFVLSAL